MAAWLSDNKPLSQVQGTCPARVAPNMATTSSPPAIPQTNPFTCGRVSWSPKASAGKPSRRSNILLPKNSRATPHAASIARAKSAPGSRFGKNITPANANPYATTHKPRNSQRDFFCTAGLASKVFRFSSSMIKQHLRIKSFYGASENAVKTQIWIDVLVAIVRKRLGVEISLYQILPVLSVTLFEKTPILQALQPPDTQQDLLSSANQLILFD